jgi:hypothetical protein
MLFTEQRGSTRGAVQRTRGLRKDCLKIRPWGSIVKVKMEQQSLAEKQPREGEGRVTVEALFAAQPMSAFCRESPYGNSRFEASGRDENLERAEVL